MGEAGLRNEANSAGRPTKRSQFPARETKPIPGPPKQSQSRSVRRRSASCIGPAPRAARSRAEVNRRRTLGFARRGALGSDRPGAPGSLGAGEPRGFSYDPCAGDPIPVMLSWASAGAPHARSGRVDDMGLSAMILLSSALAARDAGRDRPRRDPCPRPSRPRRGRGRGGGSGPGSDRRGPVDAAEGWRVRRDARRPVAGLARDQARQGRDVPAPRAPRRLRVRLDPFRGRRRHGPRGRGARNGPCRRRAARGRPLQPRIRPRAGRAEGGREPPALRRGARDVAVPAHEAPGRGPDRPRRPDPARHDRRPEGHGVGGGRRPERGRSRARRGRADGRGRRAGHRITLAADPAAGRPQGRLPVRSAAGVDRGEACSEAHTEGTRPGRAGRRRDPHAGRRRPSSGPEADVRQRHRRLGPVFRPRPGRARRRRPEAGSDPHAARRVGRGDRPGAGLQVEGLGPRRRADEPAALRLRLGGVGPARRDRGARPGDEGTRARSAPDLSDRALNGRARYVAPRRDVPRPLRRDRARARAGSASRATGDRGGPRRATRSLPWWRGHSAQRYAGPRPQPRPQGRLHPPRRRGRQRPGRPGQDDAQGPRRVPPRLRLLRAPRRRALVGRRVLRLAPPARLPRPPRAPRRGRRPPDRLRDRRAGRLGEGALGGRRGAGQALRAERDPPRRRPVGPDDLRLDRERCPARARHRR